MCGIYGSVNFHTYEKLYIENQTRGNFAGGSLYVRKPNGLYLKKWSGSQSAEELTGEYCFQDDYSTFLGHTQAPTSSSREYSTKTTHPFEHGWWIVAHNGVLENDEYIRENLLSSAIGECDTHVFDTSKIPVDSAVIPALIDEVYIDDDVSAIRKALEYLKGTFACWMYSKHTQQTYLARSGSTLFGDISESNFSSTEVSEYATEPLKEGIIYCVTTEGLAEVGSFTQSSPFFLL